MSISTAVSTVAKPIIKLLELCGPVAMLGIRLYVANVFWKSGVNKFQSWESTLFLFEYEYQVPVLSPKMAAIVGTGAELFFPVLLAIGLGGRFAAISLFIFNIVAVVSYPTLNEAGIAQHQLWGLLLFLLVCYGPGKLSIDHLIRKKNMRST